MYRPLRVNLLTWWSMFDYQQQLARSTFTNSTDKVFLPYWCIKPGFDPLSNSGLSWTIFARNKDTAVPAEGNGDLQTLICVLVARPRQCPTLSHLVRWQNWMAAYLGYTLWMKTLFRGWLVMVHDMHMRRIRCINRTTMSFISIPNLCKNLKTRIHSQYCGQS